MPATNDLTDSRKAVMNRIERGMVGAREIAEDLGISRNAVYQQIQWLRRNGYLPADWTPTGLPAREAQPGAEMLAKLVGDGSSQEEVAAAGAIALVQEIRRTRDELDAIARRLSAIVPR